MLTAIPIKIAAIAGIALALALGLALWRVDHLKGELRAEQIAHKATHDALQQEVEKGLGWKTAYGEALEAAKIHRDATQECIKRAAEAETARKEREAVLQAAQPHPRTDVEKQQVVNDATRNRAADRLNRPF